MSTLTLGIIVIIYMFVLAWLGYLGYKHTKNASDYLLGGRKVNSLIMALSYGATFISASAIVGFGGVAATFGMGIQWLCLLNMFMGVVIAFIFFGRRTRRLGEEHNARTFPQLLGAHYQSRAIQAFIASIIFIGMPLYAAVVMKGGAVFIEQTFHIDLHLSLLIFTLIVAAYVITGGIKGVLYTDALQAIIMFTCMLFLLFWFYRIMGLGFIEANQKLTDIAPLVPEHLKEVGHQGWTAMPVTGSPQWYTLVTSLILGVGVGCLAQPQLVVRFMMVESSKQLNRGVLIGCLFLIITVGAIYHVGALSNLYFLKTEGVVASEAIKDIDKIIPLFINNIRHRKPLPVYGKGENVRDWLYVEDHARAIDLIFHQGRTAETYNIGGFNEWKNIDIIKVVIRTVDRLLGRPEGQDMDLITYVTDRAGHDLRYAIDSTKLQRELGWEPSLQFEEGIEKTVRWYLDNQEWMDHVTSGAYQTYYEDMYKNR